MLGPKPGIARGFDDTVHGAADQYYLAPRAAGGFSDRHKSSYVRGKGRNAYASLGAGNNRFERGGYIFLRNACSFEERIGTVADKDSHAFITASFELGFIGGGTPMGRLIEFPVPSMKDVACGCAEMDCVAFGNRVRNRNKVDVERPDSKARSLRYLPDGDFGAIGILLKLS